MSIQRTQGPTSARATPGDVEAAPVDAPKPAAEAPETRKLDAQADLRTRTAAQQQGARGNLAAILADQNAGRPPASDLASVASLTAGEAFGPRAGAAVERVMGQPVTRAGLEKLYGSVLPDTHVFVRGVGEDRRTGALDFAVEWKDNQGRTVAKLNRRMARHPDGDLELYSHGCWVEPSHRSRAVSAAVMQREIELLQSLSPHPRNRLTLWAGGVTDPNDRDNFERVGHYVWATMGFDCAQRHGSRSRLPRGGGANKARCPAEEKADWDTPDFTFVRQMAQRWVTEAAARGELPDDPELLADLEEAFRRCDDMWSIATLDVPGLTADAQVGGRKTACHVGKAFLLSEESPRWEGVFLVGKPAFLEVGGAYCEPRVARARDAFEASQAEIRAALEGDDDAARLDALAQVAEGGDPALIPALEHIRDTEPALAEAARAALDGVTGVALTRGLFRQSLESGRSVKDRLRSLDLALERDPGRRQEALLDLLAAPKTGGDFEVARTALDRLARARTDADTLLDAAHGLWTRAAADAPADEPEPPQRRWGRPGRSGAWQRDETRKAAIRCIDSLALDRATDALAAVAKAEPDRELAAGALAAWMVRVGDADPAAATAAGREFLEASHRVHAQLDKGERGRRSEESRARTEILEALGQVGGDDAVRLLERAAQTEPFYEGIRAALRGLDGWLGEEDPERVHRHVAGWLARATNSPQMRADCIELLAERDSPVATRALLDAARVEEDERPLRALHRALDGLDGAQDARARVGARLEQLHESRRRKDEW